MEETLRIDSIRWYPRATEQDLTNFKQLLLKEDSAALIVLPVPDDPDWFMGLVLAKYYTPLLSNCTGVRNTKTDGTFYCLHISSVASRGFMHSVMRKLHAPSSIKQIEISSDEDGLSFPSILESELHKPQNAPIFGSAYHFLQSHSPAQMQKELSEYVIGQQELTRAVADFLYYHILRQVHPSLPQRPLMICGPSGSGKTEVWRVARRLYGHLFPIKIVDGSNLSCEGWSGNYKVDTYIDASMVEGGILVVDEFDKLTKPKHSSSGDNVSLDIQSEFLKLVEGEYQVTEKRKQTKMTSQKMGFVLVGAFESLRAQKAQGSAPRVQPIGFCTETVAPPASEELTDEDFIAYGILPELVGRIAVKCASKPLPDSAYLDIIRGPHSRVAQLEQVLRFYGINVSEVISAEELTELVRTSKCNHTGVRWVSAQVESRLLEAIYEQGIRPAQAAAS